MACTMCMCMHAGASVRTAIKYEIVMEIKKWHLKYNEHAKFVAIVCVCVCGDFVVSKAICEVINTVCIVDCLPHFKQTMQMTLHYIENCISPQCVRPPAFHSSYYAFYNTRVICICMAFICICLSLFYEFTFFPTFLVMFLLFFNDDGDAFF